SRTAAVTCRICSAPRSCCSTGWRASTNSRTTWIRRAAPVPRSRPGHFPRRRGRSTRMAKRVGVLLSGCGRLDGSDISESILTLLVIERAGARAIAAAPDPDQAAVIDHVSGERAESGARNAWSEAARLRGAEGRALSARSVDAHGARIV